MKGPIIGHPLPHFDWGQPTRVQKQYLAQHIHTNGPMSIYGDDGIYKRLEERLCTQYPAEYCILTNTGTSALNSGYFGLGLGKRDEVIVPTYTFLATVTPLLRLGCKLVFCDADPQTGNICPEDLERKISGKTKAVAITHMWGVPCDMERIMPLIIKNNLRLVEDCSHSHFTTYRGRLVGTFGDVSCFSIGAKKTLTSGEGGFLLTSDPEIYLRATLLGHFDKRAAAAIERVRTDGFSEIGEKYKDLIIGFGENYRIHPYSAVMAFASIDSGEIFELISQRRESLQYFTQVLRDVRNVHPPEVDDDYFSGAMYGFKGRIDSTTYSLPDIIRELRERNLDVKLPDSQPLHSHLQFSVFLKKSERFPGVARYLKGRVSFPTFSRGLTLDKPVIDEYARVLDHVCH